MSKADFDSIYTAADPRPYFRTLGGLDYQIPAHGADIFGRIGGHLRGSRDRNDITLVDLCCSYGINAALLRHDVDYDDLVAHYSDESHDALDSAELTRVDRDFFGPLRPGPTVSIVGVDASAPAIDYALGVGLLDEGGAEDLEVDDPSPALAASLGEVDLVTCTGGIGYITGETVSRVLETARGDAPWVAALCLRWIDFESVAEAGESHGLVTERLDDVTFPQRRFASDTEQHYVLDQLDARDIDATGRETEGWHHTDLYLMRPEGEADAPVSELVTAVT